MMEIFHLVIFSIFIICLVLYRPLNQRNRLKKKHSLMQQFQWHSQYFNETWKIYKAFAYLKCNKHPYSLFSIVPLCTQIQNTLMIFFCTILYPCFRVSMEINCFPSFGLFCKSAKWGHARSQIRVNAWTGLYPSYLIKKNTIKIILSASMVVKQPRNFLERFC